MRRLLRIAAAHVLACYPAFVAVAVWLLPIHERPDRFVVAFLASPVLFPLGMAQLARMCASSIAARQRPPVDETIAVVLGVCVYLAALILAYLWLVRRAERQRCQRLLAAGLCPTCEYNVTGNTSGICPECGTTIPAKPSAQPKEPAA